MRWLTARKCATGSGRANDSRWDDIEKQRPGPTDEERAAIEQDFALGELIYELRTSAGLSQRELAERMGTTQSVISPLRHPIV